MAPAIGLMMVSGCSIVLNLDDRRCESHDQCSADGSSMCVLGICEDADATTNSDTTNSTSSGSGSTTSEGSDSMSSTSGSTSGSDTISEDESSSSVGETGDDTSTSTSSTSTGTAIDDTSSTGCSDDECGSTGDESTSSTGDDESTGEPPAPVPVELITNNTFETTTVPWTHQGNVISGVPAPALTRSTDEFHGGAASGLMRNRGQHWAGAKITVTTRAMVNVPYHVSVWVKLADPEALPSTFQLAHKLDCVEFSAASYLPIFSTEVTPEEWTELSGEMIVPQGCTLTELSIYIENPFGSVEPFPDYYIDDTYATPIVP